VSASDDLHRYVRLIEDLYTGAEPPLSARVKQVRLLVRLDRGEDADQVARGSAYTTARLLQWHEAVNDVGLWHWLGKKKAPDTERWARARSGIAQILLGQLAEEHFEANSVGPLGAQGFRVEDERIGRTDTDYRLLDPDGRPVCRLNIKFHGTLFKQAVEYVGLDPQDCFALATYKIHGALQRQNDERVPYVFLIISVPDFPRDLIEKNISDDWAWLASLSGRAVEEAIARRVTGSPWVSTVRRKIQESTFRVISARRADNLLRTLLFDRVHALRLRGFNQNFRGAEINMHLSLSREMIGYDEFLGLLAAYGSRDVTVRLDRGEI
jgi:hypothetical protein